MLFQANTSKKKEEEKTNKQNEGYTLERDLPTWLSFSRASHNAMSLVPVQILIKKAANVKFWINKINETFFNFDHQNFS